VTRREILVAALLICIGCVQMAGDVFRILPLKAFGAASHASPAPKVFTAQDGFETYANRFHLEWRDATGAKQSLELTAETYSGISGPYNRRNVYGAVFSYAPVLEANPVTRPMFRTVLRRGLCGSPSVLTEVGLPTEALRHGPLLIRLEPRRRYDDASHALSHEVRCDG
jgi:hypothetical protein